MHSNWHSIKKEEIIDYFNADAQKGLDETQVQTALQDIWEK